MGDQELNLKLVAEVEKYEVLYNYKLPGYSRKDITDKAWHEIGVAMNMTGQRCLRRNEVTCQILSHSNCRRAFSDWMLSWAWSFSYFHCSRRIVDTFSFTYWKPFICQEVVREWSLYVVVSQWGGWRSLKSTMVEPVSYGTDLVNTSIAISSSISWFYHSESTISITASEIIAERYKLGHCKFPCPKLPVRYSDTKFFLLP
ncbi:hypothetical protein J6590_080432 [Homalodisca vitripennis]|nr:hypothetical protein J6590_080432 [Homalodisca vitripennis]